MINRYDSPEISEIWKDQNKFTTYLQVELALVKALEGKLIPDGIYDLIKDKAKVDPKRIDEIEKVTKHDVIAFCTSITENLPGEVSKYFHYGCTSSDIIDTATNLQIKQSVDLIIKKLSKLLAALEKKAVETKYLITMGRSHGMNAEPMSFGQKFLSFYAELYRRYEELKDYYDNELTGQISGAVGNYTILSTEIELEAIESLGLKVEDISTQVIPRDRIAKLISINALIASSLERVAVEIRHLHHSDINEVYEGFSRGQKGSSIMPHKKNPISGENISGLARVIRSHLSIAHENIPLWHERDISHSSAERMMLPDNLGLTFYAINRMTSTIENLVINEEKVEDKVFNNYTYLTSYILHQVLNEYDGPREDIYPILQEAAFKANDRVEFFKLIKENIKLKDINFKEANFENESELKKIYLKDVDKVFERVLKNKPDQ